MAAPILWAPGTLFGSVCRKNLHAHKNPRFRGVFGFFGGGSANFIFMGAGIFLNCAITSWGGLRCVAITPYKRARDLNSVQLR